MSQQLDFRARSVSEIVDGAFQLYRRDAVEYIAVAAVAFAPVLLLQLLGASVASATPELDAATVIAVVVSMLGFALMSAVLVHYSAQVYLGRPADVRGSLRATLPKLPALLAAGAVKVVLFVVALLAATIPLVIMSGIVGMVVGGAGRVGAVLGGIIGLAAMAVALLAGAYPFARYFATSPVIVLERVGVAASLRRSSVLSAGRKWRVVAALGLAVLLYWVGAVAVLLVGKGVEGLVHTRVVGLVLNAAYTAVAYPLVGLTEMLLYYDARIRSEGYDVEVLAGALEPVPASAASAAV